MMYRTAEEIESEIETLASSFPDYLTQVRLPEESVEGRPIHGLRLTAPDGGEERGGVLLIGGTHARELMNVQRQLTCPVSRQLS